MATTKTESTHTAFRMQNPVLHKLKYIAWYDRETFTETMHRAAELLIKKWEKDNQPITDEELKKAKII